MSKIMLAVATLLALFSATEAAKKSPSFEESHASASSTLQIFMEVEKNVGVPVIAYNSENARVLIKSWDTKKCMALRDDGKVESADCNGNDKKQLWQLHHKGDSGGVVILSYNGRCLGGIWDDGRYVVTNTKPNWCGDAGHYWRLTWFESHLFLINGESNKCLSKLLYTGKCEVNPSYQWAICSPNNPEKCWVGEVTLEKG